MWRHGQCSPQLPICGNLPKFEASRHLQAMADAAQADHNQHEEQRELLLQLEQLRQTVLALRGSLEQTRLEADQQQQALIASSEAEKQQLRATIDALREQLEQQQQAHQAELQRQRSDAAEEIRQLQQALVHQRDLLEQQAMRAVG